MPAAAAIAQHQLAKLLEIFRERCSARAHLWFEGLMDLHEAVDELWAAAERDGLVKKLDADEAVAADVGAQFDHVQWIMSEAFGRWRLCDDG